MAEAPMVLRMAEAMYDRFQERVAHNFTNGGKREWTPQPFAEVEGDVRDYYIASARAGLEMLREPDDDVLDSAAVAACDGAAESVNSRILKAIKRGRPTEVGLAPAEWLLPAWQAMIDAALATGDESDA